MISPVVTLALNIKPEFVFRGVVEGLIYALVAFGIVLVFRATGIVNFAHGQVGAFGAVLMATLAYNYDIPYWLSFPLAVVAGAAIAGATELLVVRRLFTRPRLLLFVATLGVSQVILFLTFRLPEIKSADLFPTPINKLWRIGGDNGIRLRGDQLMVLITVPILAAILAFLLTKTAFGKRVKASADNPNAAAMAGINVRNVSTQVWVIAGVLSVVSAALIGPIQGTSANQIGVSLGPALLLRALAAAMFGRLVSFPLAALGGVVIGVVETLIRVNTDVAGADSLFVFGLLIVLVLFVGRNGAAADGSWSLSGRVRVASEELARLPFARWATRLTVVVLFLVASSVPFLVKAETDRNRYTEILVYLIIALSATVLTGWAGQLSLGQFAFAGVGAYATAYYSQTFPYPVALLFGVVAGVLIALVIGIPALRVRGLYLAVITLGFQLACSNWLFNQPRLNNASGGFQASLGHRHVFTSDLFTDKRAYYFVCLGAVVLSVFLVSRVRRTGIGRSIIATRDNENSAAAFTIAPTRAKLIAFAVSGGLAALAGGLYAASSNQFSGPYFAPEESLRIVAISIVGGAVSIIGAVLGTFVVQGLPVIFDGTSQVKLFASGIGMLILLMYFPGGLISIVHTLRDLLYGWISRRAGIKPRPPKERGAVATLSARSTSTGAGAGAGAAVSSARETPSALETHNVSVNFGGRVAVDHVSIRVQPGEVVGLIGTNGAGKSTLMNAISGFVPCTGDIEVLGRRVDQLPAHRRARLGMGRAFQNARLFGSLTVRETLMSALESRSRSLLLPSMLYLPPSPMQEARKRREADEIISYLGLGRYADSAMAELSTGTRRIVELASLIALDAKLLLLDEPTAGVAQRETEAFGPLIAQIRKELGASILLIEHDMPLVMSISDRIYCLEAGAVIAEGPPAAVRSDPKVIASYLGTDERAIQRSDTGAVPAAPAPSPA